MMVAVIKMIMIMSFNDDDDDDDREFKIQRLRTTNYGWTSVVVCL